MVHEEVGDLLNNGVIPVLDVITLGQRQSGRLELEPGSQWQLGGSLEIDKTHIQPSVWSCRHGGVGARALGGWSLIALLESILHDLWEVLLRFLVALHNLALVSRNALRRYSLLLRLQRACLG